MQLLFKIEHQKLTYLGRSVIASGSYKYLSAKFEFTDDWNDVERYAQFTKGDYSGIFRIDDNENICDIPWEVVNTKGQFRVAVFGAKGNNEKVVTANEIVVAVEPSGYESAVNQYPTPDYLASTLVKITEVDEKLAEAENDLNQAKTLYEEYLADANEDYRGYEANLNDIKDQTSTLRDNAEQQAVTAQNAANVAEALVGEDYQKAYNNLLAIDDKLAQAQASASTATTKANEANNSATIATQKADSAILSEAKAKTYLDDIKTLDIGETLGEGALALIVKNADDIANIAKLDKCKNKLDVSKAASDTYINPNGVIETITGRYTTDYIKVYEGAVVTLSRKFATGTVEQIIYASICLFNNDKQIVAGGNYNKTTFVVPSGVMYVRVTIPYNITDIDIIYQLELTSDGVPTEPVKFYTDMYSINADVKVPTDCISGLKDNLIKSSKLYDNIYPNKLNAATMINGYIGLDGRIVADDDVLCYSDFIPVKNGETLRFYGANGTIVRVLTAYNLEKQALSSKGATYVTQYVVPNDVSYVRLTTYQNIKDAVMVTSNIITSNYVPYGEIMIPSTLIDGNSISEEVVCYLPKNIYLVVGMQYEIYNNQICPQASKYRIVWNIGQQLNGKVRLSENTIGNKILRCSIYGLDGKLVKEVSSTLNIVPALSKQAYLLSLGDSLTNHCVWQSELMNMSANINCVGSRSRTVADSNGRNRVVYDEGRAGFTSFNYTNGDAYVGVSDGGGDEIGHNKWYDTSTSSFSMSYYITNHHPSNQALPNIMTFFLGMNDLLGNKTIAEIVANMKTMIDNIRVYNRNMPIVICSPQIQYLNSLPTSTQKHFIEFAQELEKMADTYSNVAYVPLCIGMDSANNYPTYNTVTNAHYPNADKYAADITHPAKNGYWQIADLIYGAICQLMK